MSTCIRGCIISRKHLDTCPLPDHQTGAWVATIISDENREALADADHHQQRKTYSINRYGGIDVWHPCEGCKPREATNGYICSTCHNRLLEWLTGDHGLSWTYWWLGANLNATGSQGAKQDWQRPGAFDGPPAPIRLAIYDLRQLMSDVIYVSEERTREVYDLEQPVFDLDKAVKFLAAWQEKIEDHPDLVVYVYDKIYEVMRDSGAVCPWRDQPTRIAGVPCPECDKVSLVRYNGEDNVTCTACRGVMNPYQYTYWTKATAAKVKVGA